MPEFIEVFATPTTRFLKAGRYTAVALNGPHRVLSTSHVNGGQSESLTHLANHQSCEGKGHTGKNDALHRMPPAEYHAQACLEAGLPPATTALMGTAASMDYASLQTETWEDLSVTIWATAGVRGNAARIGDPARWHERESQWVQAGDAKPAGTASPEPLQPGTINTLVLIHQPISPGALARAVMAMTEAKAAVLTELAVPSLQGFAQATGTGTDQYAIASPLAEMTKGSTPHELTWSGHHTKLGELLGQACLKAYRETLRWQNGLEPSLTRQLLWAGKPFGLTEEDLQAGFRDCLEADLAMVATKNMEALLHHPKAAAGVYAMRALEDRFRFGSLPDSLQTELRVDMALWLARQVGGSAATQSAWRATLARESLEPRRLIAKALALGFGAKWS
jgi:adenosylcobinamide amidohydrolase